MPARKTVMEPFTPALAPGVYQIVWALAVSLLLLPGCKKKGGGSDGGGGAPAAGAAGQGPGGRGGEAPGSGGTEPGGSGGTAPKPLPGTAAYDCSDAEGSVPPLVLRSQADGFLDPVLLTHPPGDERLFVVERDGRIKIAVEGGPAEVFLDITEKVYSPADGSFGEQGLLGLAFHPDYAKTGAFFVHYSSAETRGDTIIERYSVSDDLSVADEDSGFRVLTVDQPADNHNGGTIAFGADGYLYIGLGDGGGGNDRYGNGQNAETLLGGILRIEPSAADSASPYSVPAGNLSETVRVAAPELWASGLRNPYRFNFDACNGDLYIGDVGQDGWEEISFAPFGSQGLNFGWPIMEGKQCRPPTTDCDSTGMVAPLFDYQHPDGDNPRSVVGGAVYRGSAIPALRGQYLFSDSYSRQVWRATVDVGRGTFRSLTEIEGLIPGSVQLVSAIQNGPDGELYLIDMLAGEIFRLEAR